MNEIIFGLHYTSRSVERVRRTPLPFSTTRVQFDLTCDNLSLVTKKLTLSGWQVLSITTLPWSTPVSVPDLNSDRRSSGTWQKNVRLMADVPWTDSPIVGPRNPYRFLEVIDGGSYQLGGWQNLYAVTDKLLDVISPRPVPGLVVESEILNGPQPPSTDDDLLWFEPWYWNGAGPPIPEHQYTIVADETKVFVEWNNSGSVKNCCIDFVNGDVLAADLDARPMSSFTAATVGDNVLSRDSQGVRFFRSFWEPDGHLYVTPTNVTRNGLLDHPFSPGSKQSQFQLNCLHLTTSRVVLPVFVPTTNAGPLSSSP